MGDTLSERAKPTASEPRLRLVSWGSIGMLSRMRIGWSGDGYRMCYVEFLWIILILVVDLVLKLTRGTDQFFCSPQEISRDVLCSILEQYPSYNILLVQPKSKGWPGPKRHSSTLFSLEGGSNIFVCLGHCSLQTCSGTCFEGFEEGFAHSQHGGFSWVLLKPKKDTSRSKSRSSSQP